MIRCRSMLVLAMLSVRAHAEPRTLVVPDEYPTIAAALESARAGDTVRVKAGTYAGGLTLRDGVALQGEGMDRVIVETPAEQGPVVTVRGCDNGSISGMTIQHTRSQKKREDDARAAAPLLQVISSSVRVTDCILQEGVSWGIFVKGRGSPLISKCLIRRNHWNGILVSGPDATPKVQNNECEGNLLSGIYFDNGALGRAESNRCHGNTWHGIVVEGEQTAPLLVGNQCSANQRSGIYFGSGAAGTAEGNQCSKNGASGIDIDAFGTNPLVRSNTCVENGGSGVYAANGARGIVERNTCEANRWHGIVVSGPETSTRVTANRCTKNHRCGIYISERARGTIEDNVCEANRHNGIEVADAATAPTIAMNTCKENHYDGLRLNKQHQALVSDNTVKDNNKELSSLYLVGLLKNREFPALDSIAQRCAVSKRRVDLGDWELRYFYDYLVSAPAKFVEPSMDEFLALVEAWRKDRPDSKAALVVLARAHLREGWEARGEDFYPQVTEEGRKRLAEEARLAWDLLEKCVSDPGADPGPIGNCSMPRCCVARRVGRWSRFLNAP